MSICATCRLALRRTSYHPPSIRALSTTTKSTAADMLATPTWSIRSLLPSASSAAPETITPKQLHHLLRLSALPLPSTPAAEASMIATLQSQLQFVRAVQGVDTRGVEPLRAIRDETDERGANRRWAWATWRTCWTKVEDEAEKWDALATASRTMGKYFVVRSGKDEVLGGEG
ncbi:hypothetical protein G7046_g7588 [Stylonectria norvegica]|nr:hypothetical protein G7046_g7588 [Stylonectria norvegica]